LPGAGLDCVDSQFWGEQKPIFCEAWPKVDSTKLHRKRTKTGPTIAGEKGWLEG
jgi:hypothetical protein